jgi:hypothetical protein
MLARGQRAEFAVIGIVGMSGADNFMISLADVKKPTGTSSYNVAVNFYHQSNFFSKRSVPRVMEYEFVRSPTRPNSTKNERKG